MFSPQVASFLFFFCKRSRRNEAFADVYATRRCTISHEIPLQALDCYDCELGARLHPSMGRWVKDARDERHNAHRAYILKCSSCGLRARGSEMPHKALVPANGPPVCNGVSIAALDELPKGVFCYCGANHPLSICWLLFPLC